MHQRNESAEAHVSLKDLLVCVDPSHGAAVDLARRHKEAGAGFRPGNPACESGDLA